jgi:two-component system cell cycle response regulator
MLAHELEAAGVQREAQVHRDEAIALGALFASLDARDSYTSRHSEEVVELSVLVTRELGMPESFVEEVRQVALLHDIGKLGIPEDILHTPGPLEPEEWAFVRRHPLIGERIIGAAPALAAAAKLVRSTHERLDGSGYPDRRGGEEIPLGSRVIAVCDAFTAMTAPRPYAAQRTIPEAIAELRRCAGSQFDPAVVDTLSELVVELVWPSTPSTATAGNAEQAPDRARAEARSTKL